MLRTWLILIWKKMCKILLVSYGVWYNTEFTNICQWTSISENVFPCNLTSTRCNFKWGPRATRINPRLYDYQSGTLQWRHNERNGVSNHQHHDCLLHRLFRRKSKKTSKLRVTGLCAGNSPMTGEFPAQRASNAENVSISIRSSCMRRHKLLSLWEFTMRIANVWTESIKWWTSKYVYCKNIKIFHNTSQWNL